MEVGTLKELDVKPGDVVSIDRSPVEWVEDGRKYTCYDEKLYGMATSLKGPIWVEHDDGRWISFDNTWTFRIISRAPRDDTPKTWGEMTDAEKGALLLAAHEGKVIEYLHNLNWIETDIVFSEWYAYRIKPEPKRETVRLYGRNADREYSQHRSNLDTHRITFDLI